MEKLPKYRELVERLIQEYGQYKPRYGDIEVQTICVREASRRESRTRSLPTAKCGMAWQPQSPGMRATNRY